MGYDFGYSWVWTHGHLVPAAAFALLAGVAWKLRWRNWIIFLFTLLSLWGLAGFVIVQNVFHINHPVPLPTGRFLAGGSGRVLDVGAGSGRSALMVLLARPEASVVTLDNYSADYIIDGLEKLRANMRAAGVSSRFEPRTGDMREMPFESGEFDAAVSVASIDHLTQEGIRQALGEVNRVLRPRGEFLLMTLNRDGWVRFAYPFLAHGHSYYGQTPVPRRWRERLQEAGFEVIEEGTKPVTLYFLCRKK